MKYFDITKSIALVAIIAFLWFHVGGYIGNLNKSFVAPATLKTIGIDALKLSMITANNEEVDKLRKEFAEEKSKILEAYESDRKHTNEVLEELGQITGTQRQTVDLTNRRSDKITDPKNPLLKYEFKKLYAKDAKGDSILTGWVQYYPNQTDDKRWKTGTYPLEYHTKIIETENKDGTFNRYAEMHLENNQMKETKGKQFPIKLESIEWAKVELDENSWSWNPRISVCGVATTEGIYPGLGISFFSYGKTIRDMNWKFLSAGIGGNADTLFCFFEPVSWNFGNVVPLIENAFVGPVVDINTESEMGYGVNLSVPF